MDSSTAQRLTLCRHMFMRGQHELEKGTETGAFNAIREFHDALEIFLVAIADTVGVRKRTVRFHEYPGEIKNASGVEFFRGKIVDEVNDLRTPYKHHGIRPNPKVVAELAASLEIVLEKNAQLYFKRSFGEFSLADIIEDPEIRGEVKTAEDFIASEDWKAALEALSAAFGLLLSRAHEGLPFGDVYRRALPREMIDSRSTREIHRLESDVDLELRAIFNGLNHVYESIKERLDILELGINLGDYWRFKTVTPTIHVTYGDRRHIVESNASPLLQNEANSRFCLRFVLETSERIQANLRIYDSWSSYIVRTRRPTTLFAHENDQLTERDRLEEGHELEQEVRCEFVIGHGYFWRFGEGDDARFLRMADCKIVEEKRLHRLS